MSLFTKKKITPAGNFSEIEQGVPIPVPLPPPKVECDCEECKKLYKVLGNQTVIVQNQQVILDQITATQQLLLKLAGDEEAPAVEEEPSEEELQAALQLIKRQKIATTAIKKKVK